MLRVFEAEAIADHRDGKRLVVKKLFGIGKNMIRDNVHGGTTCFSFDQGAEIAVRQAALVGKIGDGG